MNDTIFILIAVAGLLFAAGVLTIVFVRDLERVRSTPPHAKTDLTNMTILFHTMRDVLTQQKQLAEDFNRSLDRRVEEIRNVVEVIRKERAMLKESREHLNNLLSRARELETQARAAAGAPDPTKDYQEQAAQAGALTRMLSEPEEDPEPEIPTDDLIATWTGLDMPEEPEVPAADEPPEPVAPEDAEAARQAFRTLLNMPDRTAAAQQPVEPATTQPTANGRDNINSVEQLVYEYSDAGMRIPEIAKELGVGKGEVRLILSLRKTKGE